MNFFSKKPKSETQEEIAAPLERNLQADTDRLFDAFRQHKLPEVINTIGPVERKVLALRLINRISCNSGIIENFETIKKSLGEKEDTREVAQVKANYQADYIICEVIIQQLLEPAFFWHYPSQPPEATAKAVSLLNNNNDWK
jgi:hypothetical protein